MSTIVTQQNKKKPGVPFSCLGCCSANTKVPKPDKGTPKAPEDKIKIE